MNIPKDQPNKNSKNKQHDDFRFRHVEHAVYFDEKGNVLLKNNEKNQTKHHEEKQE